MLMIPGVLYSPTAAIPLQIANSCIVHQRIHTAICVCRGLTEENPLECFVCWSLGGHLVLGWSVAREMSVCKMKEDVRDLPCFHQHQPMHNRSDDRDQQSSLRVQEKLQHHRKQLLPLP